MYQVSNLQIRLYLSRSHVQCRREVAVLQQQGESYEVIDVPDPNDCRRLHELTGYPSVPQAIIDGLSFCSYDKSVELLRAEDLQVGAARARTRP